MSTGKYPPICETPNNQCPYIKEAADAAVKEVFAKLGVDVDIPKELELFRINLRFGATLRRVSDRGMLAFIGAVTVGIVTALGVGIAVLLTNLTNR